MIRPNTLFSKSALCLLGFTSALLPTSSFGAGPNPATLPPGAQLNGAECRELLTEKNPAVAVREQLIKLDPETFEYRGLTDAGIKALKEARDALKSRQRLFDKDMRSLDTVHHQALVARMFKGNMFLYGPPGGAKSMIINWLMKGERDAHFALQLHQMLTEQAFIGGQKFDAAKDGKFEVETKGSLADHVIGLIDEVDKGNPAALASLLSLLNERQILAGGQVIKAKTETVFATSNANLPEIFQQFVENGQGSTAPALLNRFQFKAFVYNWLTAKDQAALDKRNQERRRLKALAETNPEVLKHELFQEPEKVNWAAMRQLANNMFKPSQLFMVTYREFVNDMRKQTNDAIRASEEKHKQNPIDEPFVYFPSADYTERLRQQIPEVVIMSAFLDFMASPMATDENIRALIQNPIELDPLSLWRGMLIMTTSGPGRSQLTYDAKAEQKLNIDWGWTIDATTARDQREELLIRNLKDEQERFRLTFLKHMNNINLEIKVRARNGQANSGETGEIGEDETSFELQLIRQRSLGR